MLRHEYEIILVHLSFFFVYLGEELLLHFRHHWNLFVEAVLIEDYLLGWDYFGAGVFITCVDCVFEAEHFVSLARVLVHPLPWVFHKNAAHLLRHSFLTHFFMHLRSNLRFKWVEIIFVAMRAVRRPIRGLIRHKLALRSITDWACLAP